FHVTGVQRVLFRSAAGSAAVEGRRVAVRVLVRLPLLRGAVARTSVSGPDGDDLRVVAVHGGGDGRHQLGRQRPGGADQRDPVDVLLPGRQPYPSAEVGELRGPLAGPAEDRKS